MTQINNSTSKFFNQIKQLCQDHYCWLKVNKSSNPGKQSKADRSLNGSIALSCRSKGISNRDLNNSMSAESSSSELNID